MKAFRGDLPPTNAYARVCKALARAQQRLGGSSGRTPSPRDETELSRALRIIGLGIEPETVLSASRMATTLSFAVLGSASVLSVISFGLEDTVFLVVLTMAVPFLVGELIRSRPKAMSRRIASGVVKDSTGAISLMVMSLRREPSLSRAIAFASARKDRFSAELRACTWGVIMGRFASFEDALQALGERWSGFCGELKTALNALITASCEATEDGRRRALDRASNASILGVKRRIEEYALSLSTPSMIMFGLSILLPLMVGSLLPMLSWDVWASPSTMGPDIGSDSVDMLQIIFIMNILFPALGLLVAMGSVSRHPLETGTSAIVPSLRAFQGYAFIAVMLTVPIVSAAVVCLDGLLQAAAVLVGLTVPAASALAVASRRDPSRRSSDGCASEEVLFRTGARMVEGENFESALRVASKGWTGASRMHIERSLIEGARDPARDTGKESACGHADAQVLEAFSVVGKAASKDERAAGLLAMDIATYLRDLRETERSLRSRLKPTISMMSITSYVLAPVVLGITYAMYMTLGAIAGSEAGSLNPGTFFIVLGLFLAESNAVVQYFIWGIESRGVRGSLAGSIGSCVIVSELVFVSTAMVAG